MPYFCREFTVTGEIKNELVFDCQRGMFSTPHIRNWLWGSPSFLYKEYRVLSLFRDKTGRT
jgi:hypothetical protein